MRHKQLIIKDVIGAELAGGAMGRYRAGGPRRAVPQDAADPAAAVEVPAATDVIPRPVCIMHRTDAPGQRLAMHGSGVFNLE